MLLLDYPIVTDKQLTQYRRTPKYKWRMLKNYSKFTKQNVRMYGYVFQKIEDPVVPLGRNLYGHALAGLLWERQFEKPLMELGREKVPNWDCFFVHRKQKLFLSVCVDDIKMAGKKQNLDPMCISCSRSLRIDPTGMQTKRDNYWTIQQDD